MYYEIRKNRDLFTLHNTETILGEIAVDVTNHDISGHLAGFGDVAFIPKGFLFWHYWDYIERGANKYRFRINNWRHLTLKDEKSKIELDGKTVKIDDEVVCSISSHVKNANLNSQLVKRLLRNPKSIYDEFAHKPIFTFELDKEEYLPFAFASCVQEWVRSTL
jgi:hypothetical protein